MANYYSNYTGNAVDAAVARTETTIEALTSEVTRATTAEAAILATALGTGTENAYDVPMKVEKVSGIQMNQRLKELILSRRGQQTNGLYRFEHAQGHQALLLMGGNVSSNTPNANNFASQIVIGDVNIVTAADFIYPDEGFENGLSFSAATVRILSRRIKYTGNGTEYTVTQWASKLTLL